MESLYSIFICCSISEYGFDFVEISHLQKNSAVSLTPLSQSPRCHWHRRVKLSRVIDTAEAERCHWYPWAMIPPSLTPYYDIILATAEFYLSPRSQSSFCLTWPQVAFNPHLHGRGTIWYSQHWMAFSPKVPMYTNSETICIPSPKYCLYTYVFKFMKQ